MRIVSLVPCLTETVAALGAVDDLVGVTRYCVHPADLPGTIARVGGVHDPDIAQIRALAPDLVLVDREENRAEDAAALRGFTDVLVASVSRLDEVADVVAALAARIGRADEAEAPLRELRGLPEAPPPRGRALVPLWPEPLVLAGPGTYIADMLRRLGWALWAPSAERYPRPTLDEAAAGRPDLLVLPTEPYAFAEANRERWTVRLDARCSVIVDGEDLCWYGARTPAALRRLAERTTIAANDPRSPRKEA